MSLIAVAVAFIPLIYLAIRGLGAGQQVWNEVVTSALVPIFFRSTALAIGVALCGILIAVPMAFLTMRTDLPGGRIWALAGALPLVIPSYVGALAFVGAFGPRGLLQQALEPLGVNRLPELYGFVGALVVLTLFTYPYLLLLVSASLRSVDTSLERAARGMGSSPFRVFVSVIVPQLRSSIAAGALLSMLYVLGDFGVVSIMRVSTFTREIYLRYNSLFDPESAAVLGLLLCAVTVSLLILERQTLRGVSSASHGRRGVDTTISAEDRIMLGRWKIPAVIFVGSIVFSALVVPVAVLVYWMIALNARASLQDQFVSVLSASLDTVSAASAGALLATLFALPIGILCVRAPGRFSRMVESTAYVGYALPGLVVALGLVYFATRWAFFSYGTIALLVTAYAIRFMPQNVGATRAAVERVDPALESAARGMGRTGLSIFRRVTLPLAAPGIAAGAVLTFLTAMKELPATLILRPIGFETLATEMWQKTAVSNYPEAAFPALTLIAVGAVPLYLLLIKPAFASDDRAESVASGVASG